MKLDEHIQSDIAHSPELQTIKHALSVLREEYKIEGDDDQFLKTVFLLINEDKKLASESVKYLDQFL